MHNCIMPAKSRHVWLQISVLAPLGSHPSKQQKSLGLLWFVSEQKAETRQCQTLNEPCQCCKKMRLIQEKVCRGVPGVLARKRVQKPEGVITKARC